MRVDVLDDLPHAFGHGRCLHIQEMRSRHRDVGDRLADLEKLKPARSELLAEHGRDLERKPALIVPTEPEQARQIRRTNAAGSGARHVGGVDLLNNVGQMRFAEMLFHFFVAAQALRLGEVQANVFRLPA